MRRMVWTLVAVLGMFALGRLTLPGVNRAELAHLIAAHSRLSWGAIQQLSVIALGITPVITAFICVEFAALIVPRFRPLRQTPEGRRKLAVAVAATAIAISLIQAYFTAVYLEALSRGGADILAPHMRLVITATLTGGTMVLVWLVSVIQRRGLGNGYAVLMVAGFLMGPNWHGFSDQSPLALVFAAGAIAFVVVCTILLLRMRVARERGAPIPLPSAGLVPLSDVGGVSFAIKQVLVFGFAMPASLARFIHTVDSRLVVALLLLIAATVLWSWVFARPSLRKEVLVRAGYAEPDRSTWVAATVLSAIALAVIYAVTFVLRREVPGFGTLAEPFAIMFIAATALDLVEEVRERKNYVTAWPLHDPMLATVVRDNLRAAGIPHYLQSARLRSLLWFFGPYVPIMVLVPEEHAVVAEQRLRALLVPA